VKRNQNGERFADGDFADFEVAEFSIIIFSFSSNFLNSILLSRLPICR